MSVSVLLPIAETIFVNLWTAAPPGEGIAFVLALFMLVLVHASLLFLILIRQNTNPVQIAASLLELEEKLERANWEAEDRLKKVEQRERETVENLTADLARKTQAHEMLRTVLDRFNLQTCQLGPEGLDAFSRGLMPVIQIVACSARNILGIKNDHFTIELYCLDPTCSGEEEHENPISNESVEAPYSPAYVYTGFVEPALFYSSWGLKPHEQNLMRPGSAFHWRWPRCVPGTCCIESDKYVYYENGKPREGLYFRTFATVPVYMVCTSECIGILAITSMQVEPFSPDILDTMEFLSSVISQYISSHSRCVNDFREKKKKEEEKRRREERKALKQTGKMDSETQKPTKSDEEDEW